MRRQLWRMPAFISWASEDRPLTIVMDLLNMNKLIILKTLPEMP